MGNYAMHCHSQHGKVISEDLTAYLSQAFPMAMSISGARIPLAACFDALADDFRSGATSSRIAHLGWDALLNTNISRPIMPETRARIRGDSYPRIEETKRSSVLHRKH